MKTSSERQTIVEPSEDIKPSEGADHETDQEIRKRERLTIATHSGEFHADDVMACALAKRYLTAMGFDVSIVRTRDQKVIDSADMAIDVGGERDPSRLRFDHHQDEFSRVASAGQISSFFSHSILRDFEGMDQVIRDIDQCDLRATPNELSSKISTFNVTWDEDPTTSDRRFEDAVATVERGLEQIEAYRPEYKTQERGAEQSLSDFISSRDEEWNPERNKEHPDIEVVVRELNSGTEVGRPKSDKELQELARRVNQSLVHEAVVSRTWAKERGKFVGQAPPSLLDTVAPEAVEREQAHESSKAKGEALFLKAVEASSDPEVVEISNPALPWPAMFSRENLDGQDKRTREKLEAVNYVRFQGSSGGFSTIAVPDPDNAKIQKTPFPKEWRVKRGDELVEAINKSLGREAVKIEEGANPNNYFCHGAGFFLSAGDKETMDTIMAPDGLRSLSRERNGDHHPETKTVMERLSSRLRVLGNFGLAGSVGTGSAETLGGTPLAGALPPRRAVGGKAPSPRNPREQGGAAD